ncbi:MAG: rod shape-determining protein MreC [Clostridiales Family XIII bacterium]|jgi:rod shape-determining protein MreC|nr:rod shape-determining protein MreC [Clostridiales Family XIII bacterium]
MRWIRKHTGASTIIAVFAALLILVLVSYQTFGESNILGRAAGRALGVIQTPFAQAARFLDERFSVYTLSNELVRENERLRVRVEALERELSEARLSGADLTDLEKLSEALNYADIGDDYELVTADVIGLDRSSGFNIFTINVGSEDGVSDDSVVIDGDGLIGRVMTASENTAKVISIIDETNKVGFQVFRNLEWLGMLQGDGAGGLTGYMLDETAAVREGDRLVTSAIGGFYPPGLMIGKVTSVEWNHDSPLKTVHVEPAAYFKSIRKVTVLL